MHQIQELCPPRQRAQESFDLGKAYSISEHNTFQIIGPFDPAGGLNDVPLSFRIAWLLGTELDSDRPRTALRVFINSRRNLR